MVLKINLDLSNLIFIFANNICLMISATEENYIKSIYHLSAGHQHPVLTSEIAGLMDTSSASVTDMIKRLAEKSLIEYERYKGVRITRKGERVALGIIRRHRLWEVFLTDILKFRWDEVHEMAEELEHVSSDELVSRLDAYLGYPRVDPHGDPIPDIHGKLQQSGDPNLSEAVPGTHYAISGVLDHSSGFLQFLQKKGLMPGVLFMVMERDDFDRSMLLQFEDNTNTFISHEIAKNILIKIHVKEPR